MAPIDPAELAVIRKCERTDCNFVVTNAIEDLKDILQCMSNHILSLHPVSGGGDGGGGGSSKSNAAIPMLQEDCDEIAWQAWVACFERWQAACKITDKQVENRILEAIPNQIADQVVIGLNGTENKADLMAKIKKTDGEETLIFFV